MNAAAMAITASLGLFSGILLGVATNRPVDTGAAIATTEASLAEATTAPTRSTTTERTRAPTTSSISPTSAKEEVVGITCNQVASDRTGSSLISIRRLESVSFQVEICQAPDGAFWYHGFRRAGDVYEDSITLPAIESAGGVYEATNSGWLYEAAPDRIVLTSPQGQVAVDQPLFEIESVGEGSERLGTLLVDVANLRAEPSLAARSVRQVTGQTGVGLSIYGRQVGGWLEVELDGSRGWIFGAFVSPPDPELSIARTRDEDEAVLLDRRGNRLEVENASGSYVLVVDDSKELWQVILPDGSPAYVWSSDVRTIAG